MISDVFFTPTLQYQWVVYLQKECPAILYPKKIPCHVQENLMYSQRTFPFTLPYTPGTYSLFVWHSYVTVYVMQMLLISHICKYMCMPYTHWSVCLDAIGNRQTEKYEENLGHCRKLHIIFCMLLWLFVIIIVLVDI